MSQRQGFNYIEIAILEPEISNSNPKVNTHFSTFQTCVSETFFNEKLACVAQKKSPYKFFPKSFKTYVYNDLQLENTKNEETNLFSKTIQHYAHDPQKKLLYMFCKKDKKAFHAFPSTSHMSCIFYTNRLAFRITNRFYLNFDIYRHAQDENTLYYKIFININCDRNVDVCDDLTFVEKIQQFLSS